MSRRAIGALFGLAGLTVLCILAGTYRLFLTDADLADPIAVFAYGLPAKADGDMMVVVRDDQGQLSGVASVYGAVRVGKSAHLGPADLHPSRSRLSFPAGTAENRRGSQVHSFAGDEVNRWKGSRRTSYL